MVRASRVDDMESARALRKPGVACMALWNSGNRDETDYSRVWREWLERRLGPGILWTNGHRARWRAREPVVIGSLGNGKQIVLDAVTIWSMLDTSPSSRSPAFVINLYYGVLTPHTNEPEYRPAYGYQITGHHRAPTYNARVKGAKARFLNKVRWTETGFAMKYKNTPHQEALRLGVNPDPFLIALQHEIGNRRGKNGTTITPHFLDTDDENQQSASILPIRGANHMSFRPLHDRVLVRRTEAVTKTAAGLVIPDTATEKPQTGEVLAVGSGARDDTGAITPVDVSVGDSIIFGKWAGTEINIDGEDLLVLQEKDIMGVVAEGSRGAA